jgi:ankyrin repeat protein
MRKIYYESPIWILRISLILILATNLFSEENNSDNKFSGNWIEYTRWGFEIKRILGNKEIIENYDDFGQIRSKQILNLTFPDNDRKEKKEESYLIKPNSKWHYLTGKNKPKNLKWSSSDFEPGNKNWQVGQAGFGYADNDDKTILEDMINQYSSIFIRKEFIVDQAMDLSRLTLAINFDDGFVVHMNGRYLFSHNAINDKGQIKVENHEANGFEFFPLAPYVDAFNVGKNVIGIEGYNASLGSSDFTLDPYLVIGGGYTDYLKSNTTNKDIKGGYMLKDGKLQESILAKEAEQSSKQKTFYTLNEPKELLLLAARNGEIQKIENLLKDGVSINATTDNSYTAISYAAAKGDLNTMNFLIKRGANLNKRSKGGKTPLLVAAGAGQIDAMKALIEKGADLKVIDSMEGNALHQAAVWRRPEIMPFLLEKGFDINSKAIYGATPLHWAVYGMRENRIDLYDEYSNFIELILRHGANKSLKSLDGKTASDWARDRKLIKIAEILEP